MMNTYEYLSLALGILMRLAVPIVATTFGVWLLRRLDARWQMEALRHAQAVGGTMLPIQNLNCWDVHDCSPERKAKCSAYLNPTTPCWDTHCVNGQLQEACRHCAFRKMKLSAQPATRPQ